MDQKGEPQDGALGLKHEELPQMDGSCDACEPDEAQPATHVCYTCSFAFCSVHADRHASSTHHPIMPYNHEGTQANGLGNSRDFRVGDGAEDEANQDMALLRGAMAKGDESGDAVEKDGAQNGVQLEAEPGDGAEGAEAGQEAAAAGEAGKNNNVTVERLRCKEHEQEGSLYCKNDEKVICVLCAVQGEHREHEIITLFEAYAWQKSREGYDLLGCTQRMSETIKTRWTNPEMSVEELEAYVNSQFDELRRLVRLEEKRTLHLVDLKEAFLTASAAEKIAEISVETERLQEEMANITHQLCLLEKAEALGPAGAAVALAAVPPHRVQRDIENRPRFPEPRAHPMDPRDFDDNDSGPSMDHAP
ncbi:tripartite motif-containing protein 44 [Notothenia coriiceps]|uniref:Tripartite motif-containing protein 44 n=1 Tax=Notothenia coriiceps TaxID=8208 RepID=A0A6I9PS98_9TELE|nr:PREDICTED: tripartite motif-containing protein 44 [Notothenia coriiceps]XP_010790615.1 PREDICTED: tripartite motif-containing protein 44 [Notothenia coriiceps]